MVTDRLNLDNAATTYFHFFKKKIMKNTHASKVEHAHTHIHDPAILLVKDSVEVCPLGHQKPQTQNNSNF